MSELNNYTNKAEIQKICESSLKDLLEYYKIEREVKFKTLQFYGLFLSASLVLVTSTQKLDLDRYFLGIMQIMVITIILLVITMLIRQFIAIRCALNSIYLEYTSRLRYIVKIELSKNSIATEEDIKKYFNYYFNEPKNKKVLLRPGSADYFEIKTLFCISIIFSLLSGLAIFNILSFETPWLAGFFAIIISSIYGLLLHIHIGKWSSDLKEPSQDTSDFMI